MKKKLLFKLLLLSFFINANAARIFVDSNATGVNNGTSWADAYTTIEDALNSSIIGDEIWIKSGVYKPASSNGFDIPSGIKVYGGFAGTESHLSERDLLTNTTTLNGDIGNLGVDSDNANHVVSMTNVSNQTRLDGFRIINGNANNVSNGSKGGGLYNLNGSPTIANCVFISNKSKDFGGAIVSEGGTITIEDCDINNNTSADLGGGIYFSQSGTGIIRRTKINRNTCTLGSGGGVSTGNGVTSLVMDRCEISGNTAQDFGGAATIGDDTDFHLYNSIILGNISDVNTIYMHTTFNTGTHKISNCTFSGNNLGNNSSSFSTTIRVTTNTQISNSIFWDNDSAAEIYRVGAGVADPSVNYCLIDGGFDTGTGNISISPNFNTPGTPNLSPFSLDDGYDYTLPATSPAINAGNNSAISGTYNLDFSGNSRMLDGTVDLGAYEHNTTLSIDDYQELMNVNIFYNSETETLEISNLRTYINENAEVELRIFNTSGQKVFHKKNIQNDYINTNMLAKGFYVVKLMNHLSNHTATKVQKVIIH